MIKLYMMHYLLFFRLIRIYIFRYIERIVTSKSEKKIKIPYSTGIH